MLKLIGKLISGLLVLINPALSMTVEQETALGHAAGEYYGAVVLNEEFKKSRCGSHLKIPSIWYDPAYAMQDIKSRIPDSVKDKKKAIQEMPRLAESLRRDANYRIDLAKASEQQCQVMAKRLYNITTPLIMKWNDLK